MRTLVTVRTSSQDAISSDQLIRRLTLTLGTVTFFAKVKWIAVKARRACALITAGKVLANGIDATCWLIILITFIDVATVLRDGVACVTLTTDTNVRTAGIGYAFLTEWAGVLIVTLH